MRGGNSVKKIDLGVLSGDILVFGGVYSNLHALDALISHAVDMGIAIWGVLLYLEIANNN